MTSSVIYYSTDARKNEIYLLNNIYNDFHEWRLRLATNFTRTFWAAVVLLPTLFNVNTVQLCSAWISPQSGVAMLNKTSTLNTGCVFFAVSADINGQSNYITSFFKYVSLNLVPMASVVERVVEGPGKRWLSHDQIFEYSWGKFSSLLFGYLISVINFTIYWKIWSCDNQPFPGPLSITYFTPKRSWENKLLTCV